MEDGSRLPLWGICILLFLVWLCGVFYGFAAAMQNLNSGETEKKAADGDKAALRIVFLQDNAYRYLNLIPVLFCSAAVSFGSLAVPDLARRFPARLPEAVSVWTAAVVIVFTVSSLGILAFRRVGRNKPDRFARKYQGVVYFFSTLLFPVTFAATWVSRLAARPFGVPLKEKEASVTEEEIISMVDEAHEQGVIEENEAEMIQNIMELNDTNASDIMTHRKNVVAFDEEVLLQEMVDGMLEEGNSRYPVYRENLDNIVGVVHYKDALKFITKNPWAKFKPVKEIPGLIRKAAFIPETRGIDDLFHTMQDKKLHFAVVVDEYGQTAGIVTMEDILEEIVGEILDEYDEEDVFFRTQKDNSIVIDGLANLSDVEERLSIEIGECDFETLNGVLTDLLGHIPTVKDLDKEIDFHGYRFRILSLGNKTIGKVKAEKINNEKESITN